MNRKFTLIELIVVIAVLGILAAIIVPNIQNVQGKATQTAIVANAKNLQTSVDMYVNDHNGEYPTVEQPQFGQPQPVDWDQVKPEYLRSAPKTKGVLYWVDNNGIVWTSTVDSPMNIEISGTKLIWDAVPNASAYNVYEVTNGTTSAVSKQRLNKVATVTVNEYAGDASKTYAVSAVDRSGNESAPVTTGYEGQKQEAPAIKINSIGDVYAQMYSTGYTAGQGDWLYYADINDNKKLYKIKTDDTQKTKLLDSAASYINLSGNVIYYVGSDNTIYKMNNDGTGIKQLNTVGSKAVTLTQNQIYYVNTSDQKLYHMNFDGSQVEKVDTGSSNVIYYQIINNILYFVDQSDHVIAMDLVSNQTTSIATGQKFLISDGIMYVGANYSMIVQKIKLDSTYENVGNFANTSSFDLIGVKDGVVYAIVGVGRGTGLMSFPVTNEGLVSSYKTVDSGGKIKNGIFIGDMVYGNGYKKKINDSSASVLMP